jgi:subtilisin-like proprotein convertase family protein
MKKLQLVLVSMSIIALAAGSAFATKQDEINNLLLKPWSLQGLPGMIILADVNETEPNDVCPGEAHTLGDTFHGAINVGGDLDWISFSLTAGDELTIGTDADGGLPTVDTLIELWDDTCGLMLTSDDDGGPGLYSLISNYAAPYTGTYSLKIRAFGAASTGNYIALGSSVTPAGPGFCPIGQYKGVKRNVNLDIPDNDPVNPLVCPPITFNPVPGLVITDVVVDLNIEHTWVGDLIITLQHTSDGGVVTSVDLVNQPGVPETGFGCSGDLVTDPENKYYFSSRPDLAPLGEFDCPSVLVPACYNTAIENGVNDLSIFNGLALGDGTWELIISDNAAGDTGYVYNWSVHLLADAPVSVESSSWGNIKASYR